MTAAEDDDPVVRADDVRRFIGRMIEIRFRSGRTMRAKVLAVDATRLALRSGMRVTSVPLSGIHAISEVKR